MKKIIKAFYAFALHFGLILCLFTVLRILFYLLNLSSFPNPELINFIGGIRFDWMTIIILYAPYLLLYPFLYHKKSLLLNVLFSIFTAVAIILSGIDFEYYKFTLKRTTADLFTTDGMGNDFANVVGSFILDFWYVILLAVALFVVVIKLHKRIRNIEVPNLKWPQRVLFIFVLFIFYGIGFRGGLQLRPLNVIQAGEYANAQNIALVLNTPFTIIKSSYKEGIQPKDYYTDQELNNIYTPLQSLKADSSIKELNVVLLILESFSKEYIGEFNEYEGYTPFLDSIIRNSLSFTNAFANGKKSIEGLPAILSGIPTLMNDSYISGKFASNRIESIASFLGEKGYKSSFYHGGENGTMGFKAYTQIAGIENYIGKNEYPNKGDYDGKWGIFDEPFLQFCAKDILTLQEPFFATIFTLSSHHPYTIPKQHEGKFKEGPLPILKSIQYADYSLQQFFESIQEESWFKNTVFVITADHTSYSFRPEYINNMGYYRIPILFYAPEHIAPKVDSNVVQQNDIFPSVIDFLGHEHEIVSFGNSAFDSTKSSFSVSYLNDLYQFIEGDFCLYFNGEQSTSMYNWKKDPLLSKDLLTKDKATAVKMEQKLKAIIQQYNNRLINNQLTP